MAKRKRYLKVYRKNEKRRKLFFIIKLLGSGFLLFAFCSLVIFIYYAKDLPRPEKFLEKRIFQSTQIYDRSGEALLYTIHGEEKREIIPLDQMSPFVKQAVITIEDANFYKHHGLDPTGILRSILVNLKLKKPAQGGSTITQQLIRSSFLTLEKTAERKVREIILSVEIERRYPKDQILEWYLNQVPFGSNSYGVEAASQTYFQKPCKDITLAEAATLASLIRAPSYLSPYGPNKEELLARKDYILGLMLAAGTITKEQHEEAKNEDLKFAEVLEPIKAPHFVLQVKNYLVEKYGEDLLMEKGFRVYTSIDWELQEAAEEAVASGAERNRNSNAYNASLVAIDPNTGEILALVGSADWFGDPYPENCVTGKDCLFDPKFNTAIGTKTNPGRQPGSAFKPFAYATAFRKGFTSETILWDAKTEFNLNCSSEANEDEDEYGIVCYHPQNYDTKYRGPITLRESLAQSVNLTSVKVLYLAGVAETIDMAERLGITTLTEAPSQYGLSLVLGGGEVKLLEMVSAYGVFASEGYIVPPVSVLRIEDSEGNILEENKKTPRRVLETEVCRMINDILSDNEARTPVFGPVSPLYFENYQVAAKTGTTQEYRDAWTIGYTPSIVAGVWAGNNDNTPSNRKPGVALASPIWNQFMAKALLKYPKQTFNVPKPASTSKAVLSGEVLEDYHSILYYLDKDDPHGATPTDPGEDLQYEYWEKGIEKWLLANPKP